MQNIYLFDVDGTLTPPRMPMDKAFETFFDGFAGSNKVVLISGSDYKKIQEQVPQDILNKCDGVYGCSGAEYFENDVLIHRKEHAFPDELMKMCQNFIDQSAYDLRCGTHIEKRPGMLNISAVGRDANAEQRKSYHAWDMEHQERIAFVDFVNKSELPYEASAGGEISIDIVPVGWNKSVVKHEVLARYPDARLTFFGDKIAPNGNDLPLAEALNDPSGKHTSVAVESYEETWEYLIKNVPVTKAKVA